MMTPRRSLVTVAIAALLLSLAPVMAQAAGKFAVDKELKLTGQGGLTVKVPDWKASRPATSDVAVFEHDGTKAGEGVYLLMVTIEPGPSGEGEIDWEAIKGNIVEEAKKGNATVELELGDEFKDAEGFTGRRMKGSLKTGEHTLSVELVGLVSGGKLVTVSVLTAKSVEDAAALVADVAKSATLGS